MTPESFPDAETLAAFLHGVMAIDVPFKLTAGLHHPFPTKDQESGGNMHGFVNVLTACAMSLGYDMNRREIAQVLKDREPSHWRFHEAGLEWGDCSIGTDDLEAVRDVFVGIGSCSIEEPIADLKQLGWLE